MASSARNRSVNHSSLETQQDLIRRNLKDDLASNNAVSPEAPTAWQAAVVKKLLGNLPMPLELIELIMDFAEYWPCTSTNMDSSVAVLSDNSISIMQFDSIMFTYHHWVPEAVGESILLRTEPLAFGSPAPRRKKTLWISRGNHASDSESLNNQLRELPHCGRYPVRKIVFTIISRQDAKKASPQDIDCCWYDTGSFEAALVKVLPRRAPQYSSKGLQGENNNVASKHDSNTTTSQGKPTSSFLRSVHSALQAPLSWKLRSARTKSQLDSLATEQLIWHTVSRHSCEHKLNESHIMVWRNEDSSMDTKTRAGEYARKGGALIRNMEVGDSILLRATTRRRDSWVGHPLAFMNYVVSASVCVYWAV